MLQEETECPWIIAITRSGCSGEQTSHFVSRESVDTSKYGHGGVWDTSPHLVESANGFYFLGHAEVTLRHTEKCRMQNSLHPAQCESAVTIYESLARVSNSSY